MKQTGDYRREDLLRLAKRVNNPKRSYLLVNPLQGKHLPVSPTEALHMMRELGRTVKQARPGRPLVIGFAETATAIGAAAAMEIGGGCVYLQTTREEDDQIRDWVYFSEEHSHATEQRLCGDGLSERIAASDYVLLVDDEISTGKTILNTVSAIRRACPAAEEKDFVTASILNRVDPETLPLFARHRISFLSLLQLQNEDFEEKVKPFSVREAEPPRGPLKNGQESSVTRLSATVPPPRRGVGIKAYVQACDAAVEEILRKAEFSPEEKVLILGTEEFLFPALLLGRRIEERAAAGSVRFHATTRSPIGISEERGYPITNGIRLPSFYDRERVTYLYDLERYDRVIVFTDAAGTVPEAAAQLRRGLEAQQCGEICFCCGGSHV